MNSPEMIEVVTSDLMDARSRLSDGYFCEVIVDAPYGLSIAKNDRRAGGVTTNCHCLRSRPKPHQPT